ncbi:hypothetical protein BH20CHL6_BH20CHL6_03620 [soil metagenome]
MGGVDLLASATKVVQQSLRDDVTGLASQLAYRFFLSLFPFAIFLGALSSFVSRWLGIEDPTTRILSLVGSALPPEASQLIGGQLERILGQQDSRLLSFSAVAALYVATTGTKSVIVALNRAYDVSDTRPIWQQYLVALLLTVVAGGAILAAFVLFVPARFFARELAQLAGLGAESSTIVTLSTLVGAILLLLVAVGILYRSAPNLRIPWRWVVPGAVFFAAGWSVATFVFSLYVSNFSSYANTYGALAGVAVLLIWLYVTGLIFLIGAELNEVLYEQSRPAEVQAERARTNEEAERKQLDKRQTVKDDATTAEGELPDAWSADRAPTATVHSGITDAGTAHGRSRRDARKPSTRAMVRTVLALAALFPVLAIIRRLRSR